MATLPQDASLTDASLTGPAAAESHGGRVVLALSVVAAVLILGTGALWAHYGTAVFYEMVLAGLAACF